jgi:hypothetical protein
MATIYIDSGSLNNLQVSGSAYMSSSNSVVLQVKGSNSTIFSVSGSDGDIFSVSDIGLAGSIFSVSSGSTTVLNIDHTKQVSISGSLIVTGSITGSLFGTASLSIDSLDTILSQSIVANTAVGALSPTKTYQPGTSLETILREILTRNVAGTISSFSLKFNSNDVITTNTFREVGSGSAIYNVASFNLTADSPLNRLPASASFTASGATTGNFNLYLADTLGTNNNISLLENRQVNRSIPGTVSFLIKVRERLNNVDITRELTMEYVYPIFWGISNNNYFANPTTQLSQDPNLTSNPRLLQKLIEPKGNKSVNFGSGNNYGNIIFAYPSSYSDLVQIIDGNSFQYNGAQILRDYYKISSEQSSTTPLWSNVTYTIYQRNRESEPSGIWNFKWNL